MDISKLQPEGTQTVELINPATGEPLGILVELLSRFDTRVKQKAQAISLRAAKLTIAQRAANQEAWAREFLSAAISGWRWPDEHSLNGVKNPECNDGNKDALLAIGPFFEQLNEAFGDVSGFFRKPEKS